MGGREKAESGGDGEICQLDEEAQADFRDLKAQL